MLSTLSERNKKLEDDFSICLTQLQVQATSLEKLEASHSGENQNDDGVKQAEEILAKSQAGLDQCRAELVG